MKKIILPLVMNIACEMGCSKVQNDLHTKNNYIAAIGLYFHRSSFWPQWKMCVMFAFLQTSSTFLGRHNLQRWESGLIIMLTSCLITHRCTPSGPIDFLVFTMSCVPVSLALLSRGLSVFLVSLYWSGTYISPCYPSQPLLVSAPAELWLF